MTISAANISTQDVKFSVSLNGQTWRWTTRMDVSGAAPAFQIVDILTPFGILRDSIPLPGEVVQGMGDSITSLMDNFKSTITVGPALVFDVDEGRGYSLPQTGEVTNSGTYGSLLDSALTASDSFVHLSVSELTLPQGQTGTFDITVDSTDLVASSSPYVASIQVADTTATNSPQPLAVTVNVRPLAVIDVSPLELDFTATRPISGPYPAIPTQLFTIENTGPAGSVLDFQVVRLTGLSGDWLGGFTPVTGTLNSGDTQDIVVTVAPIEGFLQGTYTETLRISGYSFNGYVDVTIQLVVT